MAVISYVHVCACNKVSHILPTHKRFVMKRWLKVGTQNQSKDEKLNCFFNYWADGFIHPMH